MTSNKSHEKQFKKYHNMDSSGHPKRIRRSLFRRILGEIQLLRNESNAYFYMYFALQENGLGMDKTTAMSIMSVYGSLIYMSSIPGGWIADRITGTRGATLIGAILIIIGHICLSLPFAMVGLFTSMFFIIVGSGLMKPNISNIVGRLYPETTYAWMLDLLSSICQ